MPGAASLRLPIAFAAHASAAITALPTSAHDKGLAACGSGRVFAEEELAVVAAEEEGEAVQIGAEGVQAVGGVALGKLSGWLDQSDEPPPPERPGENSGPEEPAGGKR